ncbi:MAG: hypothetical protein AUG51_15220 [Acidobacteria bacterium 13_1_20CM_3_53_8]|nr:MAG: hypothetical protein AUG51_15220 [Acidobacteria bacterium 13_1_20CM_3_53_8]
MQFTIDGNANLKDQENTLNFAEKGAPLKLISYIRGLPAPASPPQPGSTAAQPGNTHINLASFDLRDQTLKLPLLALVELAAGQSTDDVLKQNPGKQLVFVSDIWVSGKIEKVAGLR